MTLNYEERCLAHASTFLLHSLAAGCRKRSKAHICLYQHSSGVAHLGRPRTEGCFPHPRSSHARQSSIFSAFVSSQFGAAHGHLDTFHELSPFVRNFTRQDCVLSRDNFASKSLITLLRNVSSRAIRTLADIFVSFRNSPLCIRNYFIFRNHIRGAVFSELSTGPLAFLFASLVRKEKCTTDGS